MCVFRGEMWGKKDKGKINNFIFRYPKILAV